MSVCMVYGNSGCIPPYAQYSQVGSRSTVTLTRMKQQQKTNESMNYYYYNSIIHWAESVGVNIFLKRNCIIYLSSPLEKNVPSNKLLRNLFEAAYLRKRYWICATHLFMVVFTASVKYCYQVADCETPNIVFMSLIHLFCRFTLQVLTFLWFSCW